MTTEKRRSFIINFIYFLILASMCWLVLKYGMPLLSPFVTGFIFAYLLQKPIRLLSKNIDLNRKLIAVLITAAFFATIGVMIALLGIKTVSAINSFIEFVPTFYNTHIVPALNDIFVGIEITAMQTDTDIFSLLNQWEGEFMESLGNWISGVSVGAMGVISGMAASLPGFFVKLILTVISTFFIAADYDKLVGTCMNRLGERTHEIFVEIKNYLIGTLFVCIRSYLLIMTITFIELSIALSIIKLEHAILIAFAIAICDILPVLGTGTVMIPWAIIAAVSGRTVLGLQLIIIYLVITVIRNIIEPKIVGSQLGLHPVVTLASMFAGVQLFGVIGLFGFPIILSLIKYLHKNGTINLFGKEQNEAS
ncbi:MAG: sporulation integral membrane protein YtvI [Oscillospiraceae bacterium]|nr:sporulation integral membrane protein YtvI [Oscillospiraceae bacterium]MBQ4539208.1 sporulation integral membrane protein YtvI [Oscillospiraceae bacterium]